MAMQGTARARPVGEAQLAMISCVPVIGSATPRATIGTGCMKPGTSRGSTETARVDGRGEDMNL